MTQTKICIRCGVPKPLSAFARNGKGRRNRCGHCEHERRVARAAVDEGFRTRQKAAALRYRYRRMGISPEQFQRDAEAANGKCPLCRRHSESALVLDHDHSTLKYRGPICYKCNLMLGAAKDSVRTLLRMAWYLLWHRFVHTGKVTNPAGREQAAPTGPTGDAQSPAGDHSGDTKPPGSQEAQSP